MVGTSAASAHDSRAHQALLRRVAQNLGLQVEQVSESSDLMVDILTLAGPSWLALPLIKTIQDMTKTLWQTPASLPSTAKRMEKKYFMPSKGYEYLYTHPPPGSLVIVATNECERQGQQGPMPEAKNIRT